MNSELRTHCLVEEGATTLGEKADLLMRAVMLAANLTQTLHH